MKLRKATYLIHRWLGLAVSLQLLAWSAGGFVFSILPLESVRGERDVGAAPFEPLSDAALAPLPDAVRRALASLRMTGTAAATVALMDRGVGPHWEARDADGRLLARLGALGGAPPALLSKEQAAAVATRDFASRAAIVRVRLIESDPPVEFREGALPAYVIELDHPKRPHIYVDARTGEVLARRNRAWRVFDFFWMLHTMDYSGRDDFNHPTLTAFSVLAMLTSGSGLGLWGWRAFSRARLRGRSAAG